MQPYDAETERLLKRLADSLSEQDRRRYAGRGGQIGAGREGVIEYVAGVLLVPLARRCDMRNTSRLMGVLWCGALLGSANAEAIDLTAAAVLLRPDAGEHERNAVGVLTREVQKRTGLAWSVRSDWPDRGPVIVVTSRFSADLDRMAPSVVRAGVRELRPEGYCLVSTDPGSTSSNGSSQPNVVWIVGAEPRGVLFGVGHLLRKLDWGNGTARLAEPINRTTSPAYRLRGHQLGYRARANSYDAWDEARYEQYLVELAIFGGNAIENIPFQDRDGPHMRVSRRAMNRKLSELCRSYDVEYWVWTPADFNLKDVERRNQALALHEQLYADSPRLDGVFVPGGDPGDNRPTEIMPYLKDLAARLRHRHPAAKVWLSMQGYDADEVAEVYRYIDETLPDWLGGLVHGPSSPSIVQTRQRLGRRYDVRHYPDITHTIRCQYPIAWWDPAYASTLGREPVNPTPMYQSQIHRAFAPYTAGFISYSDGVHDDVNKVVWTRLAWDPDADVREIVTDYARFFFASERASTVCDGILALERNWQGPLATNGAVDATLALWQELARRLPQLRENWRWQMCLLRANYDCYTRHRLIAEEALEVSATAALANTASANSNAAIDYALAILRQADVISIRPELLAEIDRLCEDLFRSIGLQTSVPRFQADGAERGTIWDFVRYPLNDRWWLEDELAAIRSLTSEDDKRARLELLHTWKNPGPGAFYDDVGNVARSPHVLRGESPDTDPLMLRNPNPSFHGAGRPRARQSWHSYMDWPIGVRYDGLDSKSRYVIRTTGLGECLMRVDGQRVTPTVDGRELGAFKEFTVPSDSLDDGTLLLTFDVPHEPHLNWRQQSRLAEIWLLRRSAAP